MERLLLRYLTQRCKAQRHATTLLAVSGGVDSVVMAHLFHRLGWPCAIAHVNYGLRGQEADKDEAWVAQLAQRYQLPYHVYRVAYQAQKKSQDDARRLRYTWFEALSKEKNYPQVAVAHHRNDLLETMLHNLCRGTGIKGLRGMRPRSRGWLIRPLLGFTRQQIERYAQQQGLTWCEDRSNQTNDYTRNYLRHEVIPHLQRCNPRLEESITHTSRRLDQTEKIFDIHVAKLAKQAWHKTREGNFRLDLKPLKQASWAPAVIASWLEPLGFTFRQVDQWWHQTPQKGRQLINKRYRLTVEQDHWHITQEQGVPKPYITPCTLDRSQKSAQIGSYTFDLATQPYAGTALHYTPQTAYLDSQRLRWPLCLRLWQAGDRMAPLGMGGHTQKISDLLNHDRVPHHARDQQLLLADAQGLILWLVGHRLNEHVKLTPQTQEILRITVKAKG